MILNSQGAAELESWINGGEITPGSTDITLPGRHGLLGDLIIKAIQTETKSVTPGASNKVITPSAGKYLRQVTVAGDSDLKPENIAEGVNIFGILGTLAKGVSGIDYGKVTLTGAPTSVTVDHNLGVIPSFVALIPINLSIHSGYTLANINGMVLRSSSSYVYIAGATNTKTNTQVTFTSYSSSYEFYSGDYYWIAIQ